MEVDADMWDHVVRKVSMIVGRRSHHFKALTLKLHILESCILLLLEESLHCALGSEIFNILIQPFLQSPQMINLLLAILRMVFFIFLILFINLSLHLLISLMSRHISLATTTDGRRLNSSIDIRGLLFACPRLSFRPYLIIKIGDAKTAESVALMSEGFTLKLFLLLIYFLYAKEVISLRQLNLLGLLELCILFGPSFCSPFDPPFQVFVPQLPI
jgi:hypothetical protein